MRFDRGTVILLDLNPTVGHEQRGMRPCVVVSDPDVVADQQFLSSASSRSQALRAKGRCTRP